MKNPLLILILIFLITNCNNVEVKKDLKNQESSIDYVNRIIKSEENLKIDSIGILLYDKFFELDAVGPVSYTHLKLPTICSV